MNQAKARRIVYARSNWMCEVRIEGVCVGRASNWHHRKSAGRVWLPSNGLHACGSGSTGCHGWITEHPAVSYRHGWMVRSWARPELVPVWVWRPGGFGPEWVRLDDAGGVESVGYFELDEALAEHGMGKTA